MIKLFRDSNFADVIEAVNEFERQKDVFATQSHIINDASMDKAMLVLLVFYRDRPPIRPPLNKRYEASSPMVSPKDLA